MPRSVNYAQWYLEPYSIGTKLRALRTQKRLTLSRLATETGLSTALLSKLETDRMIPTLPTLATISRVYGVGMSYFFAEPAQHSISITRKAHLFSNSRGPEPLKVIPLHTLTEGDHPIARVVDLAPGGVIPASEGMHEPSGLVYVLEGKLQFDSGGLSEVLESGDCAYLRSRMTLTMSAVGKH